MLDSLEETRGGWRYSWQDSGALSAMTTGTLTMPGWCAGEGGRGSGERERISWRRI